MQPVKQDLPEDWYNSPKYYDMIFAQGTADEAAFLEEMHSTWGTTRGKQVLEPACGSGRLVVAMAQRGWRVRGFDISAPMLSYAKQQLASQGLTAQLVMGNMAQFTVPRRFDLAHCLVSTFKYLLHEPEAVSHLRCVAEALKPGGLYILGFHLSDYDDTRCASERWFASSGKTAVNCVIRSWPANRRTRREAVRSRLRIREGKDQRRIETQWDFRTYNAAQVRRLLAQVPQLQLMVTYDFAYKVDQPRLLDDSQMDLVLVLRRT